MTRPPAFQFYAGDFLVGVRLLSLDERGAYITLLCHQWDKGSVPGDDLEALRKILGSTRAKTRSIWSRISHKFARKNCHGFVNVRLERERRKQARFRKAQSRKGKLSAAARQPRFNRGSTAVQPEGNRAGSTLRSSSSDVRTPYSPPRGTRKAARLEVLKAEGEHVRRSQEVKRLIHDEGLSFAEASRRVGYH